MARRKDNANLTKFSTKRNPFVFVPFPKFPNELKGMVWEAAVLMLEPRIVEVLMTPDHLRSYTLEPPLLHACHGSRAATLQAYSPLKFGEDIQSTHVDFSKDTIYFIAPLSNPISVPINNTLFYGWCADIFDHCTSITLPARYAKRTEAIMPTADQREFFSKFKNPLTITFVMDADRTKTSSGLWQVVNQSSVSDQQIGFARTQWLAAWNDGGTQHPAVAERFEVVGLRRGPEKRLKNKLKSQKWEPFVLRELAISGKSPLDPVYEGDDLRVVDGPASAPASAPGLAFTLTFPDTSQPPAFQPLSPSTSTPTSNVLGMGTVAMLSSPTATPALPIR